MAGITIDVTKRLWKLLSLMIDKKPRAELANLMNYSENALSADLNKLKKNIKLDIKHYRRDDTYSVKFPKKDIIPFKLTPEEFFYLLVMMKSANNENDLLSVVPKLELALSEETDAIYDCGPAYGIGTTNVKVAELLTPLENAISKSLKVIFMYNDKLRITQPYKLIHSPMSWYLVAYCEDSKMHKKYKLARITHLKVHKEKFKKEYFNIKQYLGDAWWIQDDKNRIKTPYPIKVLFKNEAAKTIQEYNFHKTQKFAEHAEGTVVSWKLSYLEEFASWLMQWLPNIEIQEPQELKDIINNNIDKYKGE